MRRHPKRTAPVKGGTSGAFAVVRSTRRPIDASVPHLASLRILVGQQPAFNDARRRFTP